MKIPVFQFQGIVYRAHHPMWAFDPLSGEGAKKHGGRFNRPGTSALYMALDITTAWMEAQQAFPFKAQPMTMVAYEVDYANIVDLNNPDTVTLLGFSSVDLASSWEDQASQKQDPSTWKIVDQLLALNVSGIQCRSFAAGCSDKNQNFIIWNEPSTGIRVIDDLERLPKSNQSWKN